MASSPQAPGKFLVGTRRGRWESLVIGKFVHVSYIITSNFQLWVIYNSLTVQSSSPAESVTVDDRRWGCNSVWIRRSSADFCTPELQTEKSHASPVSISSLFPTASSVVGLFEIRVRLYTLSVSCRYFRLLFELWCHKKTAGQLGAFSTVGWIHWHLRGSHDWSLLKTLV